MEFSYRISEAEYLNAAKLKFKGSFHLGRIKKVVLFWFLVVICFLIFFAFFPHGQPQQPVSDDAAIQTATPSQAVNWILTNLLPFVIVVGVFAYVIFRSVPMQLRRIYRKDPLMQGQFTINISQESISIQNTAGSFSKTGWNIYDYWREGKGLILLFLHSGAYFLFSLADLPEARREELRGILTAAVPKK